MEFTARQTAVFALVAALGFNAQEVTGITIDPDTISITLKGVAPFESLTHKINLREEANGNV